jgi:hypothetical protein
MPDPHGPRPAHRPSRRAVLGLGAGSLAALAGCGIPSDTGRRPGVSPGAAAPTVGDGTAGRPPLSAPVDVATGLRTPWSVVVLPDR